MLTLKELFNVCDKYAPITISKKMIDNGEYDNSGILINDHEKVNKILFSLDLSEETVKKAKRLNADTVVTHHPAIYYPVKSLSVEDKTVSAVEMAIKNGLNVISMHLNLDMADEGVDYCLAKKLGAKEYKIVDRLDERYGYGRLFNISGKFGDFVRSVKTDLGTQKVISYGNKNETVKTCASFCGGGSQYALTNVKKGLDADVIVSSDFPHHVIKELIEYGKKIVIIPHYVAEEAGIKHYCESIKKEISDKAEIFYFFDKRFK